MCLRAHDFHYISLLNCVSHNSSHILFELFFFGGVSNAFTLLFELFLSAHNSFFIRSYCRQFVYCLCISFIFHLFDIGFIFNTNNCTTELCYYFFYCHCKTVRAFWKVVECRFSILYNAPLVGFLLPNKNLLTNQWRNSKHTHRIACMRSPHLYIHSYKSVLWLTATKIALNTPSNSSAYNAIKSFYPQRFMFSWTIFALGRCRLLILGH